MFARFFEGVLEREAPFEIDVFDEIIPHWNTIQPGKPKLITENSTDYLAGRGARMLREKCTVQFDNV